MTIFYRFKYDNFLVIAVHQKVFKSALTVVKGEKGLLFYLFVAKVNRDFEELVVCQCEDFFL